MYRAGDQRPAISVQGRPIGAFILSMIGGLFVLVGTILGYLLVTTGSYIPISTALIPALTAVTIVFGCLMWIAGLLMWLRPELHVVWGVVILVGAVASISGLYVGAAGLGLGIVGSVFGMIGGVLAIAWPQGSGALGGAAATSYRVCPSCGRWVTSTSAFCPFCGSPATIPPMRGEPTASPPP